MKLNEKLIYKRKEAQYTQLELAEMIGITHQSISKWERGIAKPDLFHLQKISEIYGTSVDYFVDNINSENVLSKPDKKDKFHVLPLFIILITISLFIIDLVKYANLRDMSMEQLVVLGNLTTIFGIIGSLLLAAYFFFSTIYKGKHIAIFLFITLLVKFVIDFYNSTLSIEQLIISSLVISVLSFGYIGFLMYKNFLLTQKKRYILFVFDLLLSTMVVIIWTVLFYSNIFNNITYFPVLFILYFGLEMFDRKRLSILDFEVNWDSVLFFIAGFFVSLLGIILFVVYKDENRNKANAACVGSIMGILISLAVSLSYVYYVLVLYLTLG